MSYSIQREVSDGTLTSITLAIEFIDQADIHIYVDDIEMDKVGGSTPYLWDWVTGAAISITPAVPLDSVVLVRRITPKDKVHHNFNAGAVFKDTSVDENFRQALYLAQEALEGGASADFYNDLDMHGYTIHNSGPALVSGDLISLGQYQSDALGAYAYRKLSERYANDPYGTQVEPGKYSAYHWSKVAEQSVGGVSTINGRKGAVTLSKTDVGLANANNTSDADKPISTAQQAALDLKVDKTAIKQVIGASTTDLMSQKAVTDAINTKVGLSGNQTIGGIKTFSSFPVTPSAAPAANYQAANKKYVDDSAIGVGQTWQDVTGSRVQGTTYTNSTGKPIQLFITFDPAGYGPHFFIDGVNILSNSDTPYYHVACIVPAGSTYRMGTLSTAVYLKWTELR